MSSDEAERALAHPLPKGAGTVLKIPQFVTGATATVQSSDGQAVSNTQPSTAFAESKPELISGYVDASQQLLDFSGPVHLDQFLARELGRAVGKELDTTLLNGSGSSGLTKGLLEASGTTALSYTDASPTPQELITTGIGKLWSEVFTALGRIPDTILWHPRRNAWLMSQYDVTNKRVYSPNVLDGLTRPTQVPAMPLVSSTQDPIVICSRESVKLFIDPPVIRAWPQTKAGNLEVKFMAMQWAAMLVREPKGVGILTGSGLTTPTFA